MNNIASSYENKILFKINNEIITSLDILNEINYLSSVNENLKNLEKEKIYQVAKNSLIREKIKEIFLSKIYQDIKLNDEDYNRLIIDNYSSLEISDKEELKRHLKRFNLKEEYLKKKISIYTFWNQYIYQKYSKNLDINVEEIKKEILKDDEQKEFLISEILFSLEKEEILENKFSLIDKTINESGFDNSALIFSKSETAKNGGKVGWVKASSINSKIFEYISKLEIDEYTKPIVVPGGFLILKLNKIKTTKREINLDQELETIIRIRTNNQLNQFANIFLNKIKKEIIINEL
tara:strand:- start:2467 stop:3345 length:879 start_codon:yes stop_codon:yes gene_type:complete